MVNSAASSRPSILLIEAALVVLTLAISLGWPRIGSGIFKKLDRIFGELARRRRLSVVVVGLSAWVLRLAILPWSAIPKPYIYDDFSYLLAGDTFASGRLTNLTHAMWVHFESFHITQLPSYMSMYFPAQGMFLAAGKVLAGHPWFGVLTSVSLMCAAFCWMLQGWLPPRWALLGGFLAILRIGLFSYWIDQYWGGAVPALGGALILGAVPRIRRNFRAWDFFWMALGMGILANSRPYEGLLVSIPALIAVCYGLWKKRGPSIRVLVWRIAPAIALLTLTFSFIGYYNYRVFGNPFTPSYVVNRAAYAVAPHFLWQHPHPEPIYRHAVIREFYVEAELRWFKDEQTPLGLFQKTVRKLAIAGNFYFGVLLLPPLVMLPRVLRDRKIRFFLLAGAFFAAGLLVETWLIPHYAAPFAAGIYLILLQCMRHMRAMKPRGRSAGAVLVHAIPALCIVMVIVRLSAGPLNIELPSALMSTAYGTAPLGLPRAQVLADLSTRAGGQLAIVRYSPAHFLFEEWVYNAADIDHSKVVWAREMDRTNNRKLLDYFKDRTAWLIEPDFNPPRTTPYIPEEMPSLRVSQHAPLHSADGAEIAARR